jgi:hypothetical protein
MKAIVCRYTAKRSCPTIVLTLLCSPYPSPHSNENIIMAAAAMAM